MFSQLFLLPVSQGSKNNIFERSAQKCSGAYQEIKTQIRQRSVVGSDETVTNVNEAKWWICMVHRCRSKTIDYVFENGLLNSAIVSNRWVTHLKNSQICLAYLLRDFIYLIETQQLGLATQFKELIVRIFESRKKLLENNQSYTQNSEESIDLEKIISQLLLISIHKEKCSKSASLQVLMVKNRSFILLYLYNLDVPPDDNDSKRATCNLR